MLELSFAKIYSSKEIENKTKNQILEAYNKNKKIFGKTPNQKFKIILCNSEEEWKKESKYYYFPFGAGTVLRDGTFVVKAQKLLTRTDSEYQKLLDHEMNHVFFALFYHSTKPVWVQEGLANFVGGYLLSKKETFEKIKQKKISNQILQYNYFRRNFSDKETVRLMYSVWCYFLQFITKDNPKKIVSFMKVYIKKPTKKNYYNLFYQFFGKNETELFQDFIK